MTYFDLNQIQSSNRFSDNLSIQSEAEMEEKLNSKIESQKWCLGIDVVLQYHVDISGILQAAPKPQASPYASVAETDNLVTDYEPGKPNQVGFVMMPERGPGWLSNAGSPDSQRWGHPTVIKALVAIATEWKRRGYGPLVYGDISLRNGGHFPPHVSHRHGLDIDIRPIGINDSHVRGRVTTTSNYDRERTREFIQLILNNGIIGVSKSGGIWDIGFQDPVFVSEGLTKNWSGHKDHLHVRFVKP